MKLLFLGKDTARRNQMRFLQDLRAQYPNVSETGIHEMAKTELTRVAPRHPFYVECLFGADVRVENPTTIEAWQMLTPLLQRRVLGTPPGKRVMLIDPVGLSKTYVWRRENNWTQDVTYGDVDVIRNSPAKRWFQDPNTHGEYSPARAWDLPVVETFSFMDPTEAKRFERDQKRTHQWNGA